MAGEDARGIRAPGNSPYDFQRARRINGSTDAITTNASTGDSESIPHGLGVTPSAPWATPHQNQHMASVPTWDSVNMTVFLRRPDGGLINSGYTWGVFG